MADPKLMLLGQDLIALGLVEIETLPDVIERRTFKRDSLITNDYNFKCKKIDYFFSTGNSDSMFNGIDWMYTPLQYINEDSDTTWSGVLIDINNN